MLWVGSVLTMRMLLVDLDTMHRCIMNESNSNEDGAVVSPGTVRQKPIMKMRQRSVRKQGDDLR